VFREVIFESGGTYYVAVPLNAPLGHPQREQLRRDAQALANLCYALEGQGVLTRPWKIAPGLVAHRKLRRQGSKFIECYRDNHIAPVPRAMRTLKSMFVSDRFADDSPAFRIYAFKSGAWPEMILGAVMGAAGRIEAERRQQEQMRPAVAEVPEVRAEFERDLDAATRQQPASEATKAEPRLTVRRRRQRPNVFQHRPGTAPEPSLRVRVGLPTPAQEERRRGETGATSMALRPNPNADMAYRQRFGSYAGLAEAELSTYEQLGAATDPANSNTARTEPASEEPVVVPFPAPTQVRGEAEPQPTIGVELRRETATFHVPVGETSLPDAIRKLSDALQSGADDQHAPQLDLALAAPETTAVEHIETIALPDFSTAADVDENDVDGSDFEPPLVLRRMVD
jgi:hypothetical protein